VLNAYGNRIIAELTGKVVEEENGILRVSREWEREFMKGDKVIDHTFTNHIRSAVVTSPGRSGIPPGTEVTLNRHDGDEFEHEGRKFISIESQFILCNPTTTE